MDSALNYLIQCFTGAKPNMRQYVCSKRLIKCQIRLRRRMDYTLFKINTLRAANSLISLVARDQILVGHWMCCMKSSLPRSWDLSGKFGRNYCRYKSIYKMRVFARVTGAQPTKNPAVAPQKELRGHAVRSKVNILHLVHCQAASWTDSMVGLPPDKPSEPRAQGKSQSDLLAIEAT